MKITLLDTRKLDFRGEGMGLHSYPKSKLISQPKRPHVERPGSSKSSRGPGYSYLKVHVIRAFIQHGLWGNGQVAVP